MNFLPYLLAALAVWMHPTNSISTQDAQTISVQCGRPSDLNGADARTWPLTWVEAAAYWGVRPGLIFIDCAAWETWDEDTRIAVMTHEVGHIYGLWDINNPNRLGEAHGGDGIMAECHQWPCHITAGDIAQMASLHPTAIVRRGVVPMVAHQ